MVWPPRLLIDQGRFRDASAFPVNNDFRFAVVQSAKIRACGDLKAAETNWPRSVFAPISPPSWERVAQIPNDMDGARRALSLGNADESDAYKKLPLIPSDSFAAAITLRGPDIKWYAFAALPKFVGSTAAVVRYNDFPRLLASLFLIAYLGYRR